MFGSRMLMHAQVVADSTYTVINTSAQAFAYVGLLWAVRNIAANLAPACAVAPILVRLAICCFSSAPEPKTLTLPPLTADDPDGSWRTIAGSGGTVVIIMIGYKLYR